MKKIIRKILKEENGKRFLNEYFTNNKELLSKFVRRLPLFNVYINTFNIPIHKAEYLDKFLKMFFKTPVVSEVLGDDDLGDVKYIIYRKNADGTKGKVLYVETTLGKWMLIDDIGNIYQKEDLIELLKRKDNNIPGRSPYVDDENVGRQRNNYDDFDLF